MVSRQAFRDGLISYIDSEIMPHLPSAGKWGMGALVILTQDRFDKLIDELSDNAIVKTAEIVDENGNIDVDRLSDALTRSAARYGNLHISVPLMGSMDFSERDVDILKQHIYHHR